MKQDFVLVSILAIAVTGVAPPVMGQAASVNIGVQTNNLNLGINIGGPPPLVVVPGTPVYTAPSLPYNYFVYERQYYLYHEGRWLRARHYDGPWTVIAVERVPPPILAVPVEYYNNRPAHWKHHGPPPWAKAKGRDNKRDSRAWRDHEEKPAHGRDRG